jgi:predicted CoA-binding protein
MPSVIILGASANRSKFGNKSLRAYQQQGYDVYPVNPHEEEIEGARAYATIAQVPVRPNVITVYLPPERLYGLLPEIAAKGCDELWLNPGTESEEVVTEARRLGLNVIQACSIVGLGISPAAL